LLVDTREAASYTDLLSWLRRAVMRDDITWLLVELDQAAIEAGRPELLEEVERAWHILTSVCEELEPKATTQLDKADRPE
jgi:hypothetical protein